MLITATSDLKTTMTVTDPAAGAVIPGTAEFVLWVGTDLAGPDVVAVAALQRCWEKVRELMSPGDGITTKITTQLYDSEKSRVVVATAATPGFASNGVGIAYGATFNVAGTSVTAVFKHAVEKFLEARKNH